MLETLSEIHSCISLIEQAAGLPFNLPAEIFAIQAIEQENPRNGRRFRFVAVAKAKKLLFDDLIQAAAWLDGVHHGMQQASDKPVMVRRPYETEATPVDDATDLTVAT